MKNKIKEYQRIVRIVKWVVKHPKEAMAAVEEAAIHSENRSLLRIYKDIKRWEQN